MTNAEINAAISAWFEPKPDFDIRMLHSSEWAKRDLKIGERWFGSLSTKRVWVWGNQHKWEPLDYFTSEDANARLLEAMRDHNPVLRFVEAPIDAWVVYLWTAGQPVSDGIPMTNVSLADCSRSPDRKTAVVLAFLKFAGIEITTS